MLYVCGNERRARQFTSGMTRAKVKMQQRCAHGEAYRSAIGAGNGEQRARNDTVGAARIRGSCHAHEGCCRRYGYMVETMVSRARAPVYFAMCRQAGAGVKAVQRVGR